MYISKECAPQYYVHRVFVEPYYACKVVNWFTHYRRKYKKKTEKEQTDKKKVTKEDIIKILEEK